MSLRDDLTRIRAYLKKRPAIIAALRDMTEDGIKAASYEGDRTTGHDTRLFCWLHQQDPHDCHKQGFLCDGDPIPTATDITGETVIRGDRARRLTAELTAAEQRITQTAANIYDLPPLTIRRASQVLAIYLEDRARHLPNVERVVQSATGTLHRVSAELFCQTCHHPTPHPCPDHTALTEKDKLIGVSDADATDGCQSCSRLVVGKLRWWNEASYNQGKPTNLGGLLDRKLRLCWTCYRFAVEQEPTRLPKVDELLYRHDIPKGRWPTRRTSKALT